jgi:rod shape-determining protein MreC
VRANEVQFQAFGFSMVDIATTRRRPLALLAIVVVAQVLLLAFQVRHTENGRDRNVPLVRYWAAEIVLPFERVGSWMFSGAGGIWSGYIDLRHERRQNIDLRAENGELELRNHQLETEIAEAHRTDALLEFRHEHPEAPMVAAEVAGTTRAMVAARVIGGSADPVSHTIFISRGAHDGIRRDMAVITPDGIVGKIVEVFPHAAQVLLINDRESGVGAMFAVSRTHGILKGTGDPQPQMDYVENDAKVHVGDEIITSGDDRIFPKGLAIGVVADDKAANPFQIIHIRTAAHLDGLEDVLVLLTERDLNLKTAAATPPAPAEVSRNSQAAPEAAAKHETARPAGTSKPAAIPSSNGAKPAAAPGAKTPKPGAAPAGGTPKTGGAAPGGASKPGAAATPKPEVPKNN